MMAIRYIVIWGMVALGSMAAAGLVATMKNRDHSFWMGWTFILPPMLLVLILLPTRKGPPPRRPTLDEEDAMLP